MEETRIAVICGYQIIYNPEQPLFPWSSDWTRFCPNQFEDAVRLMVDYMNRNHLGYLQGKEYLLSVYSFTQFFTFIKSNNNAQNNN